MNINFSFEYAVSIVIVLIACSLLLKSNPQMNSVIVIIVGLVIGYISLLFMNIVLPTLNSVASNIYQYMVFNMLNSSNSMGYVHVWPPILAILIIFIVCLYSRQLG